jgi:ABC-type Fe2+-enterobactin transport system substrate-binding protein
MNSADLCRKNGWTVGTILEGVENHRPDKIVITAIGESSVLAKGMGSKVAPEGLWDLSFRNWNEVASVKLQHQAAEIAVLKTSRDDWKQLASEMLQEIAKLKAEIERLHKVERDRWTGWAEAFHPIGHPRRGS